MVTDSRAQGSIVYRSLDWIIFDIIQTSAPMINVLNKKEVVASIEHIPKKNKALPLTSWPYVPAGTQTSIKQFLAITVPSG